MSFKSISLEASELAVERLMEHFLVETAFMGARAQAEMKLIIYESIIDAKFANYAENIKQANREASNV